MNPETATIDKNDAEAVDVVFTVTSNTSNEILGLKIGSVDVNAANYAIDSTTKMKVTIDAEYLKGLAAGEKAFTILMKKGFDLPVKITVTAV